MAAIAATLLLPLCVLAQSAPEGKRDPRDPLEGYNRFMFGVNDRLDSAVVKPVAQGYQKIVPQVIRAGVTNFFGNFGDAWSAINHLLQGKPKDAAEMTIRVATNSVFGIGGLFDVASELGIESRYEDFGQTLGSWGVPAGPYLVLPALGPSTVRDASARPLDMAWSPTRLTNNSGTSAALTTLSLIDTRAFLLTASRILDDVALDRYVFVRDAYLSRRKSVVYDGNPPDEVEKPEAVDKSEPATPQQTPSKP